MWWKFRKKKDSAKAAFSESTGVEIREMGKAPLTEVAKRVREVELVTKKKSTSILSGQYRSRFKGQGVQFSDFRVYQYGDDIRHIDWRTSSRLQQTYVKLFEEERELNLFFAVDISNSNLFGTSGSSKRETLAIALACLGFSAISNNDRVGLVLFSDRVERYVPPKKGRKHILRVIDEILTFEPKSKKSSLVPVLDFLSSTLKSGTVLVLASDFFSPLDKKKLGLLSRKHDFICLRAVDKRDEELPDIGLLRIEDPETGESTIINTGSKSFREKYFKDQKQARKLLDEILRRGGAELIDLDTAENPAEELNAFFRQRRRLK